MQRSIYYYPREFSKFIKLAHISYSPLTHFLQRYHLECDSDSCGCTEFTDALFCKLIKNIVEEMYVNLAAIGVKICF